MKRILPSFAPLISRTKAFGLLLLFSICCSASMANAQTAELQPAVAEAFGLTKGLLDIQGFVDALSGG